MTTAALLQVEEIPVAQIQPSPTNPRKHYDSASLDELAASIKAVGVQVPLSLRILIFESEKFNAKPEELKASRYEIVGGERRWRAAQIAGLTSVPAIARVMTDAECRESQLVDNLQRADLSPMEEAECYAQLLDGRGILPSEVLAAKVGKTVQYVTQRLRLLHLEPEAREAMRQGVINLTLALLIARLEPANQEKATLYAVDPKRFMQGDVATKIKSAKKHLEQDNGYYRCATESGMREWIAEHTLCVLKGVAWRLDDAELVPEAGACTTCPKRSGNATMLFGDIAAGDNTCTDPECYGRKEKAAMKQALKASAGAVKLLSSESHLPLKEGATSLKQGQWIEAKQGSCPQVMEGITEEGHRKMVCGDQKCKVHKHQVQQPLAKGQSAGNWEAERKEREAKQKAYVEAERSIRLILWSDIRAKLTGPKLLRAVLHELSDRVAWRDLAALRGIPIKDDAGWDTASRVVGAAFEKAKDAALEGWLLDVIGAGNVLPAAHMYDEPKRDRKNLWELGKLVGVDCDAIVKKATPAVTKAAPAKKAAVPDKAKPAKKGQRAPVRKTLSAESRKRIAEAMKKRWATPKKAVRK